MLPALALTWSFTPHAIATTCRRTLATLSARTERIGALPGRRTFANTVLALENATADASDALAAPTFLAIVSSDAAVRDAANACATRFADALAKLDARPGLYAAVKAAARTHTARDVYDRKLTQLWLVAMRRAGAGLTPAARRESVALQGELNALETRFGENLANDRSSVTFNRAAMRGIPADLRRGYRQRNGAYVVPVNESTLWFLHDAVDPSARKSYYLVYERRAAKANVPIFQRAIAIRDRLAHIYGYESWADYRLANRMVGTLPRAQKFLRDLHAALHPAVAEEIGAMRAAIRRDENDPNATLQPWDVQRGETLLERADGVNEDAIRQYFPAGPTIARILDVFHVLLGVDFARVAHPHVWAPGVLEYRVTDAQTQRLLGITYFDLYPRPGKFGHFENVPILPVRTVGASRVPVAAIVGNWPAPEHGEPSLLTHGDVVDFFHEFGHDMAALLATAPYETLSDGFREDFVEAPSQMLENFAWQPAILRRISGNWRTGEALPNALIAKLVASRSITDAYETDRLVTLATIDLQYHSMGPDVDTTAVWAATSAKMLPLLYVPGTYPQVAFAHMMAGYDAGLYAYPWAKVYAADLFTAFAGPHLLDPSVGLRYRDDILAPARTYEPDVEVRRFLGRPMSPDAFFAELGIRTAATPLPGGSR